jgi:hypothetical protein
MALARYVITSAVTVPAGCAAAEILRSQRTDQSEDADAGSMTAAVT